MPKMTRTYRAGDVCFAKVRGYPAWPARVEGTADETINKFKYHVFFFGTGETAVLKAEEIFPYFENKSKFDKPVKRKGYKEGLLDLQAYVIHNNLKADPALEETDDIKSKEPPKKKGIKKVGKRVSISTDNEEDTSVPSDSAINDSTAAVNTTLDDTMDIDDSENISDDKSKADESTVEDNKEKSIVQSDKDAKKEETKSSSRKSVGKTNEPGEDFTSDGSEEFNLIIDETPNKSGLMGPKAAGQGSVKRATAQKRKKPNLDSSSEESTAPKRIKRASLPAPAPSSSLTEGGVTSRSGRKIKPKKFADDMALDESFDLARAKAISMATSSPSATITKASSEPIINDFKEYSDLAGPLYTEEDSEGLPIRAHQ